MGWFDGLRRAVFGDPRQVGHPTIGAELAAPRSTPPPPVAAGVQAGSTTQSAIGVGDAPSNDEDLEALTERAAERLLDDERLRGSLTDDEFQPLLDWALRTIDRVAADAADRPMAAATERVDAVLARLRETFAAVNDAAERSESGPPDRVADLIRQVTRTSDVDQAVRLARGPAVSAGDQGDAE